MYMGVCRQPTVAVTALGVAGLAVAAVGNLRSTLQFLGVAGPLFTLGIRTLDYDSLDVRNPPCPHQPTGSSLREVACSSCCKRTP